MGGFHSGELAVQERAGVRHLAQRLSPMLAPPTLSGGAGRFLAGRDLAVITARDRGADASHRGGDPGFVHLDGDDLWWDDLPGNNMFNSLGNIAANNEAALLFLDFDTGARLHLSGRADIEWRGTDRRVRFTTEA